MKETYWSKERLDFSFSKTPVKTEAEIEATQLQAKNCQGPYELEEAGGTLPWSFQRKLGPTDSLISEVQPPDP